LLSIAKNGNFLPEKHLLIGGEKLEWKTFLLLREFQPDCAIYNHYGPRKQVSAF